MKIVSRLAGPALAVLLLASAAAAQEAEPAPAPAPAPEAAPVAVDSDWTPAPRDDQGRSVYGLYLAGRGANIRGEREAAARLLADAYRLDPNAPALRDETFLAALLSGDLSVAAELAPADGAPPVLVEAGRLASVVETWRGGDARAAHAALAARPIGEPHRLAGLYVAPWLAAAAGDWETALKPLDGAPTDPTSLFRRHERAQLLESRRRYAEAEAEYRAVFATPLGGQLFRDSYAGFLIRRDRRAEAAALYEAAPASKARILGGAAAAPLPLPMQGAAEGLSVAALQAGAEGAHEFASVYLRLALALAPSDQTRLQLGQSLIQARLTGAAREALSHVGTGDGAAYARAQAGIAAAYAEEKNPEGALEALRRADAAEPGDPQIALGVAGQLLALERFEEALAVLQRPPLATDTSFEVHLLRGSALQSLDRHDEAEAELWAALQQKPDDATALNGLGYLWVDSGRRIEQGAEMLTRAAAAEPEDGNIQDSLGWARFRQGRFDEAVETLEGAVAKLPSNPEIVDHLGDAYWAVGRKREARWQWERVLTLNPGDARQAEVSRKLTLAETAGVEALSGEASGGPAA